MVSTLDIIKKSPKIFKLFMLDRKIRNLYDIKNSEKRFAKATKMLADYQNKKIESIFIPSARNLELSMMVVLFNMIEKSKCPKKYYTHTGKFLPGRP